MGRFAGWSPLWVTDARAGHTGIRALPCIETRLRARSRSRSTLSAGENSPSGWVWSQEPSVVNQAPVDNACEIVLQWQ